MRELSILYCPRCGHYGYFHLLKHADCPSCRIQMKLLDMRYQDFMSLSLEERDCLLVQEILKADSCLSNRLFAQDRAHHYRSTIARLNARILDLEAENKNLTSTVEWMHQTIWELLAKNKSLTRRLDAVTANGSSKKPDS